MMVGREVLLELDRPPADPGADVLSVDGLTVEDERGVVVVDDVSLTVRAGEVFGIAGVDGNGQSELVESVTGLRRPDVGRITFRGEDVTDWSRGKRIREGMAFVPEDRQERGLVMGFDLVGNGVLGSQHDAPFASGGRLDWDAIEDHAADIVEEHDVRPPDVRAEAASLSGGNQQKFVVGREFARDPSLLVAMHPTRGVDIGSTEFIREELLGLRADGVGVLLVSSKLEEAQGLADRLAVMYEGDLMAVVDPAEVDESDLGLLMAGEYPEWMDERSPPDVGPDAVSGREPDTGEVATDGEGR